MTLGGEASGVTTAEFQPDTGHAAEGQTGAMGGGG